MECLVSESLRKLSWYLVVYDFRRVSTIRWEDILCRTYDFFMVFVKHGSKLCARLEVVPPTLQLKFRDALAVRGVETLRNHKRSS